MSQVTKHQVYTRAKQYLDRTRRSYAAYEEDVDTWYRSGEGRTRGYAYPACIHGTSAWRDYDNICGPCEDGYGTFHYIDQAGLALDRARADWEEFERRRDLIAELVVDAQLCKNSELRGQLIDWWCEPLAEIKKGA